MKLFILECKKILKSIIYIVFIVIVVVTWWKNVYGIAEKEVYLANNIESSSNEADFHRAVLLNPNLKDGDYGTKITDNPDTIMAGAVDSLISDYKNNIYASYPFGYYKAVVLNQTEQKEIFNIISEITGLDSEELDNLPDTYFPNQNGVIFHLDGDEKDDGTSITLDAGSVMGDGIIQEDKTEGQISEFVPQVSYDRFNELMEKVCKIIGKGCEYEKEMLISYFGLTEMTYEEAINEYQTTIEQDKVTRGFARLFCDYMVIPLGLIPIFIIVSLLMKDKKHGVDKIIYNREISSAKLVITKYMAVLVMSIIPIILLSIQPLIVLIKFAVKNEIIVDYFAYVEYILWWIVPTVMLVIAIGLFFTVLTDTSIAILVQFFIWFVSYGSTGLIGDISIYTLMIRHNTLEGYSLVQQNFQMICVNRMVMILISCIFNIVTIALFDMKRKGKFRLYEKVQRCRHYFKRKFSIRNT